MASSAIVIETFRNGLLSGPLTCCVIGIFVDLFTVVPVAAVVGDLALNRVGKRGVLFAAYSSA
jgi:hypothetical protein